MFSALFGLIFGVEASRVAFSLPSSVTECFYEDVEHGGTKLYFSFLMFAPYGSLDLRVILRDPQDRLLYDEAHSKTIRAIVRAETPGRYSLCFANVYADRDGQTQVVLVFEQDIALFHRHQAHGSIEEVADDGTPRDSQRRFLSRITESLLTLQSEQELMRVRHAYQITSAESALSQMDILSLTTTVIIAASGVIQVYFFKRLLDAQRPSGRP